MSSQGQVNPAGPGNTTTTSGPVRRIDVVPSSSGQVSRRTHRTPTSSPPSRHRQRDDSDATSSDNDDTDPDSANGKYGAGSVIKLFIPVTICMALVVTSIQTMSFYVPDDSQNNYIIYTPFHPTQQDSTGTKLWQSLANSLIMISVIGVMTFGLVLLYKKGYMCVIHVWLFLSSLMLIFLFGFMYLAQVLQAYNLAIDYITLSLVMWNFGVVGILAIHVPNLSPLLLQQAYLIICSSLMALVFIKFLPDWSTWFILAVLSIYDLAAVLLPYGPLRMLVEAAQEREDDLFPALIYSSGAGILVPVITTGMGSVVAPLLGMSAEQRTPIISHEHTPIQASGNTTDGSSSETGTRSTTVQSRSRQTRSRQEQPKDDVKLGLGDFIFYSVLVGKASVGSDWNVTLACAVSILVGLGGTLTLLSIYRKALPALPISITLGLIFYFSTAFIITPFMERVIVQQVFL